MNGKHSLVARTKIVVQKDGYLDTLLEDAENYKQNLFVGEMENLNLADYTAQKLELQLVVLVMALKFLNYCWKNQTLKNKKKVMKPN